MTNPKPFNVDDLRHAVSQFATGVVVVAGVEHGQLVGFSAQSFVSLSLNPPLVLFCPQKTSTSWPRIRSVGNYGINILSAEHNELSDAFAEIGSVPEVRWKTSPHSAVPMLEDSIAFLDCSLRTEHDAGDHTIVVSNVNDLLVGRESDEPLVYMRGVYGTFRERPNDEV